MADTYYHQEDFEGQKEVMESFCNRVDGEFVGEDDYVKEVSNESSLSGRAVHCQVDGARWSLDWDGGWETDIDIGDNRRHEEYIAPRSRGHEDKIKTMRIRAPFLQIRTEKGSKKTVTMNVESANSPVF